MLEAFIGANISELSFGVFSDCISLKDINIPNGMISIESCAFKNCVSMKYITIPNSVTYIHDLAFQSYTPTGEICMLPDLIIHCNKYSYAYDYAIKNDIILDVNKIIINYMDGIYNMSSDVPLSGALIISYFTLEGEFISCDIKIVENIKEYEITPIKNDANLIKLMLWNSLDGMQPIIDSFAI